MIREAEEESMTNNVEDFFKNRSVFITGGNGFLGKVLVEKLVRSCSGLKKVYLLLRAKGGQPSQKRIQELHESPVFKRIRKENPSLLEKIVAISGDITYPGLGISPSDHSLLCQEVSVVFHVAATIRFDEPLKRAVGLNVDGTKHVLELCHQLKNLASLVHISTAYCTVQKDDIKEAVYQETISARKIIEATEWMDDDLFESLSSHLLSGRPSSYHYTKSLAENLLVEEGANLRIAIIRPSIITASWKEPYPGWIDNYNGPTGYLVVSGKGVLRTMLVQKENICDMVPVDVVANSAIIAARFVTIHKEKSLQVFNCTSGGLNAITWGQIRELSYPLLLKHPSNEMFRYPGPTFCSSRLVHELLLQVEHNIPAYFIDFIFRITGHKPINENFLAMLDELSESDSEKFAADLRRIDWQSYMESYVLGVRKYLLKEDPATLPAARKRLQRIYYGTQLLKIIVAGSFIHQCLTNFRLVRRHLSSLT